MPMDYGLITQAAAPAIQNQQRLATDPLGVMRKAGQDFYNLRKMGRLGQYKQNMLSALSGEQPDQMAMARAQLQFDPMNFGGDGSGSSSSSASTATAKGEMKARAIKMIETASRNIEASRERGEKPSIQDLELLTAGRSLDAQAGGRAYQGGIQTRATQSFIKMGEDEAEADSLSARATTLGIEYRTASPERRELILDELGTIRDRQDAIKVGGNKLGLFERAKETREGEKHTVGIGESKNKITDTGLEYLRAVYAPAMKAAASMRIIKDHSEGDLSVPATQYTILKAANQIIEPGMAVLDSEAEAMAGTGMAARFRFEVGAAVKEADSFFAKVINKFFDADGNPIAGAGKLEASDVRKIIASAKTTFGAVRRGLGFLRKGIVQQTRDNLKAIGHPNDAWGTNKYVPSIGQNGELFTSEAAPAPRTTELLPAARQQATQKKTQKKTQKTNASGGLTADDDTGWGD